MVTEVWVHSMELLSTWIANCISKTHFFFLTDLFWGRKNTPDLFSRQRTEDRDYQSLLEGCGTQE